jgi:hypothetical protein
MKLKTLIKYTLFSWWLYAGITSGQPQFVNLDSLAWQTSLKLSDKVMIGELHGVQGNYDTYQSIVRSLNHSRGYKLIIERGLSFSYLINEYLTGSDTNIINRMVFESEAEKDFYRCVYSMNKEQTNQHPITTIGIDLEFQQQFLHTWVALNYYLPHSHFLRQGERIEKINADSALSIRARIDSVVAKMGTTKLAATSADRMIKELLLNYGNTIKIAGSSGLTWGRKREK